MSAALALALAPPPAAAAASSIALIPPEEVESKRLRKQQQQKQEQEQRQKQEQEQQQERFEWWMHALDTFSQRCKHDAPSAQVPRPLAPAFPAPASAPCGRRRSSLTNWACQQSYGVKRPGRCGGSQGRGAHGPHAGGEVRVVCAQEARLDARFGRFWLGRKAGPCQGIRAW